MNDDPDDDFADWRNYPTQNPTPAAPKRPVKKGDVHTKVPSTSVLSTDNPYFEKKKEVDSNSLRTEECLICNKNITHLNEIRRMAHVNSCLDNQESKQNFETKKEKWAKTLDCPLCGEPLGPGPNRVAHVKKCGNTYNIRPKELINLMETQSLISGIKKKKGIPHTKATEPCMKEVLPPKLRNEPKSLFEEETQMAMAISATLSNPIQEKSDTSLQFTRISDPAEKRRKRPRSYAIVELAPKSCKCEVLTEMHGRFLDNFHVRKTGGESERFKSVCQRRERRTSLQIIHQSRIFDKLSRLERLSQDLISLMNSKDYSDYQIKCKDGILFAHRCFLQIRTTLIKKTSSEVSNVVEVDEFIKIVELWLLFVYSGRVEWRHEENERIAKLADAYGPEELVLVCHRFDEKSDSVLNKQETNNNGNADYNESVVEEVHTDEANKYENTIDDLITIPLSVGATDSVNISDQTSNRKPSIPDGLQVKLSLMDTSNKSEGSVIDYENPLQGVNLVDLNNDGLKSDISDEIIVIEDDVPSPQRQLPAIKPQIISRQSERDELCLLNGNQCVLNKDKILSSSVHSPVLCLEDVGDVLTNLSRSPDIFEEGFLDAGRKDYSLRLTPLRALSHNLHDRYSTEKVDVKLRSIPNFVDARSQVDVEVIDINQSPTVKSKPPLSVEINHDDTGPSNTVDHPGYFDDYLMDDYCVFLESESDHFRKISSEDEYCYSPRDRDFVQPPVNCDISEDDLQDENNTLTPRNKDKRRSKTLEFVENEDSFFDSPVITENNKLNKQTFCEEYMHREIVSHSSSPVAHSTPLQPARKKGRFGSNVKVLKTVGITPMPDYDGMDDNTLKAELSKYGLRPMNRKRAIIMLKQIYDEVHPVIDPLTPTIRPLIAETIYENEVHKSFPTKEKPVEKQKVAKTLTWEDAGNDPKSSYIELAKLLSPTNDNLYEDVGDKTLNDSREEPLEESMIDDTGLLPKDLDGMQRAFLFWLRRSENMQLYNHILSLQPVALDELHLRLSRADSAVCGIPKKALATILDGLGVTFSLPQGTTGRRVIGNRRGRK